MTESIDLEIDALLDAFGDYLVVEKNASENTVEAYMRDLGQWAGYLEDNSINFDRFDISDLYRFLALLRHGEEGPSLTARENITKATQARKLASLKAFYRYCEKKEIITENPMKAVSPPRYRKKLPRPVRAIDLERLLEDSSHSGKRQRKNTGLLELRDKAFFELMYSTGMRVSEIISLDIDEIHWQGRVVDSVKISGKGKKERYVFITELAAQVLTSYFEARRLLIKDKEEQALFVNARGGRLTRRGATFILQQRKKRLGIDKDYTVHSLRHSFATDLLNEGADIRHIQEMLGHASLSTTQNYTKVAREKLQQGFWRHHPHARREPVTKKRSDQ